MSATRLRSWPGSGSDASSGAAMCTGELTPIARPKRCRGVLAEPRRRKRVERAEGQRRERE
eukprot:8997777-Heterocapsa_arctica.AAC.1